MARGWENHYRRLTWLFLILALAASEVVLPRRVDAAQRAGAHWASLTHDQKIDLVLGIFDGFNLNESILGIALQKDYTICSDIMEKIMHQSDDFFGSMPAGRVVSGLDAFYHTKKNRNIPISWGVWVVVRQAHHDPTLPHFLKELRKLYP